MIWTHGMINRLVMLLDGLLIVSAILIAPSSGIFGDFSAFAVYAGMYVVIYGWLMNLGGAYRLEHYVSVLRQIRQVTVCVVLAGVAVSVVDRTIIDFDTESLTVVAMRVGVIWGAILTGRVTLVRFGLHWVEKLALLSRKVVVVGSVEEVAGAVRRLQGADSRFFQLLGSFLVGPACASSREAEVPASHVPVLGTVDDLLPHLTRDPPDVVVIALPWSQALAIGDLVERLSRFAVDSFVPLRADVFDPRYARVVNVGEMRALQVIHKPFRGSLVLIKWLEDYTVATIGLILSAPLLLICALAIKLESPGPVFYRQTRVGYNNRLFDVYKLRTMAVDPADDGAQGTRRDNPRITRFGGWLRRLSIDELPQLINVLRGEMSIVGPRPHVPNMLVGDSVRYENLRAYIHRYRVKPGITGWAQINGMRGGIHTPEKAMAGIELDLYYVENWSLWLDIKIMLLTITKGMVGRDVF
ncbi:exopolysaccharide biosynthesis polyprenyl glycosylphosphotransferase [Pseudochelatococcus sp. B33]